MPRLEELSHLLVDPRCRSFAVITALRVFAPRERLCRTEEMVNKGPCGLPAPRSTSQGTRADKLRGVAYAGYATPLSIWPTAFGMIRLLGSRFMTKKAAGKGKEIFTIGHSNQMIEEFIDLLQAHGIEEVVDIRTIPKSAHNPQFNKEQLAESLTNSGIRYQHLEKLGGLRHARKDSINLGWRNLSFRGFADYMASPDFDEGLAILTGIAQTRRTAIMCAEAVPWRCHRSLVSDALTLQKWTVRHIQSRKTASEHSPTSFLQVRGGRIVYPGGAAD